ncbi:hypothetical protein [Muricoccus nepalensis]|uniref:hypothetical protein n=1 Tax=Muricoccus nepalensis TaxID=1854500 RepID=UPI0011264FFB|nr:hypothetical protein [Roseomonas nepalensis]
MFFMSSALTLNDVRIMVERRGHGSSGWFWRLFDDRPGYELKTFHEASSGYRSAEDAYDAAKTAVRQTKLPPGLPSITDPKVSGNPMSRRAGVQALHRRRLSRASRGDDRAHAG